MRCPECVQRNSVAARKCQFCGANFPKKQFTLPLKAIGVVLVVIIVGVIAISLVPKLGSPSDELERIAKSITSGPESTEHAQELKVKLDEAILKFLKKKSSLSSNDLLTALQAQLPTSIFEVLVFDLPGNTKLVEVDCVLQPSDFLIVESKNGPKVSQLFGLDVYDEGRLIKTEAGPFLILIGHTNANLKKRPNVKAIALLPNGSAVDQSNKIIPPVKGEGSIKFAKNKRDIVLERELVSTAEAEELFKGELKFKDTPYKTVLKWESGKYNAIHSLGNTKFSALYAVASALADPNEIDEYNAYLDSSAKKSLEKLGENPVSEPPAFSIAKLSESTTRKRRRRKSSRTQITYRLISGKQSFEVVCAGQEGQKWTVANLVEVTPAEKVADSNYQSEVAAEKVKELAKETPKETAAPIIVKKAAPEKKVDKAAKKPEKKAVKTNVAAKKKESKPVASTIKKLTGTKTIVSSRGVTLRSGPSTRNRKVSTVRKGQTVSVVGKEKGWYRVVVNGKSGYVWSGLIDYKKPDGYTTAIVRKKKPVRDRRKRKVSTASPGDKLVLLSGLKNNKYKVRTASGKIGYVEKDAIDVAVEEPAFVP